MAAPTNKNIRIEIRTIFYPMHNQTAEIHLQLSIHSTGYVMMEAFLSTTENADFNFASTVAPLM